ncbi:MAG: TIGR00159 family protein [Deferribacteres bacterium]|nr:diadenylate cyclase CdaA [candidate division KSB1 bacterium]MCB9503918.1 TIGR00159 family protein [Deferribacteres bacterium]
MIKGTLFKIFFIEVTVIDVLDVLILSYILYKLYFFLRGTRAAQMGMGLLVILFASVLAQVFNMVSMSWLFENLRTVWLVGFVVLFQPELRRMLIHLGQTRLIRMLIKGTSEQIVEEVVTGVSQLARHSYGGLIVMLRNTGLKAIVETGTRLQAEVSAPLLVSIFNPRSPLHDGAVIIQDNLIEAAKCILPLSQDKNFDSSLGTRHRAGLGITEESDALVIIVSEERGQISVAFEGQLTLNITAEELRERLILLMHSRKTIKEE